MIYGRFGEQVTIVRRAVLRDVVDLDKRKPDAGDKRALKAGQYVVTKSSDDGEERLAHVSFMRADRGILEIVEAIEAVEGAKS
jgi:hypothetical protein